MALVSGNQPQYGDMQRLTQLASGLKQSNADSVPTIRTPAGRPAGSTSAQAPVAGAPVAAPAGIPEEHLALMERAGRNARTNSVGRQVAAELPWDPWTRAYAERAASDADDSLRQVKELTPDYRLA